MSASGAESPKDNKKPPTGATQASIVAQGAGASQASTNQVQVSTPMTTNIFTGALHGTLGFTTYHIKFLVEDGSDTQEAVLY